MKNSRVLIFIVASGIGLLSLLAVLQYRWLGQIGDGERERLQKRLQTDSKRFADDFNREIRNAYFTFQIDPGDWLKKDYKKFNERYALWLSKTAYPNLIEDFYFVSRDEQPVRYDFERRDFALTETTGEILQVRERIKNQIHSTSIAPIFQSPNSLLMANANEGEEVSVSETGIPNIKVQVSGYLLIKLNRQTIAQILTDLNKHYFAGGESTDYKISVIDNRDGQIVFQTDAEKIISKETSDASIAFLDLSVSNYLMTVNSKVFSKNKVQPGDKPERQNVEKENLPPLPRMDEGDSVKVQAADDSSLKKEPENKGVWLLMVRHRDGSLGDFINAARRRNLFVSFGILSLLGASLILIAVAAQRAKIFAQRQLNFISSVSHEFRTPLAVIYTAGENLADGVTREQKQIVRYGELIKDEGRKLSAMVEQILEFAGARASRKKYSFAETGIEEIINCALAESESLTAEEGFVIDRNIAENLPEILADKNALIRALKNLIVNAVKYSGDFKRLKISAGKDDENVRIVVEDNGIGINKKDLPKIFEPFYRAEEVINAQIHGNGLGLSLVKQIVEAHGGKITVESKIGEGSRFILLLPVRI